jgi:endonuclease-3
MGTAGKAPMSMPRTGAGLPRETPAARRRRARAIARRLARRYPQAAIPLRHANPFQLLVATILSAQSTDAQVNAITPALFQRYRTPADFAGARLQDLEKAIHSTGFFHSKARALQSASRVLLERFDAEVPRTMEELVQLPGVGRKTANVVLSGFGVPGIVVDTHVRRLSQRMALSPSDDPNLIEQDLMSLIPKKEWDAFSLRMIYFGRDVCTARAPQCPTCPLRDLCPSARYLGSPPWMLRRGRRSLRGPRSPADGRPAGMRPSTP